jgi:hypothetical protein
MLSSKEATFLIGFIGVFLAIGSKRLTSPDEP